MSEVYFREMREKIKRPLKDERLALIRKIEKNSWKHRADVAKRGLDLEKMANHVRAIKEDSLTRSDELVKLAMESFEKNGTHAHYARTAKDAVEIFLKIAGDSKYVAKSSADVPIEVGLPEALKKRGIELLNTDFGYLLWSFIPEEYTAFKGVPMLHIPVEVIAKKVSEKLGIPVKPEQEDIIQKVRKYAENFLAKTDIGLTGANAIAAAEGSVVLVHDIGNIDRVISAPPVHVVMAGIEKVVPNLVDAISVSELSSIYQIGRPACHMNVISAPTEDWNIEFKQYKGVFGPRDVHVILVDNGRSEAIKNGYAEALYCMRCFACNKVCPTMERIRTNFGYKSSYVCGRGVVLTAFVEGLEESVKSGLYLCTLCGACQKECPVKIDVPSMITKLRREAAHRGLVPEADLRMERSVLENGNPFDEPAERRTRWMEKERKKN